MKKHVILGVLAAALLLPSGCIHPVKKLYRMQLGMTPDQVEEQLGRPYAVVASKVLADETTTMVWEYWPPFFALDDSKVHITFENDRVVQWGKPGDYGTGAGSGIREYKPQKQ